MNSSASQQLIQMSQELRARSKLRVALEAGTFAFILFFMLVGNFLTLLVVTLNRRMRTISNMFVASLAISDFGLCVLSCLPLAFSVLVTSEWPFSDITCQYQGYIAITFAVASTQTLALMAVNRYYRIVKSTKYRRYFTKKNTLAMICSAWVWASWAPLPYVLSGYKFVFHPAKFFCYLRLDSGPFTAFLVTVYVGFPTSVIFYCYLKIFQTVRNHNNNFQTAGGSGHTLNVEEVKVTRTLFVIVVLFNLCWTPVLLIDIVDTIRSSWSFPREVYVLWSFLATISSAVNPLVYGVLNSKFKKEYLKLLRCQRCRSETTVEPFSVGEGASNAMVPHKGTSDTKPTNASNLS